jgi:hypothetical protein
VSSAGVPSLVQAERTPSPMRPSRAARAAQTASALIGLMGVLVLTRFLWTKVEFNTEATGWILLPAFLACCVFVAAAQIVLGDRLVIRNSGIAIASFLVYFCFRLVTDAHTGRDVIGYTFGYTEGVLFGYGVGVLTRLLLDSVAATSASVIPSLGAVLLVAMNLWAMIGIEQTAIADNRFHKLFNLIDNETYQVSGALMSVIMIIMWLTILRAMDETNRFVSRCRRFLIVLAAVAASAASVRLAQLLGSNSAPLFVGVASVFALSTAVIPVQGQNNHGRTRGSPRLVPQIGLVSLVVLLFGLLTLAGVAAAVWVEAIDLSRYRFFGFQEETLLNSSIESRLRIFNRNFELQLQHSPLLGNMFVDRTTTGDGTYAHSLIAVLSHLGLVGAALFTFMSIAIFAQLRSQWAASGGSQPQQRLVLFGIVLVMWVLAFMLLSTFFTNILLWFTLGAVAPAVQMVRPLRRT